ncbi:MAG: DNA repair protein RadC [Lachnospiraceae bacterium]|nr:DNA repair protein RadC [Lachnospiraceae bacterium]
MNTNKKMKELPCGERPYEKCMNFGSESLSDAELLAIILRSGIPGCTSVELAQKILKYCKGQEGLSGIHHLSIQELMQIPGIGKVKAIQIKAIGELSKRLSRRQNRELPVFHDPKSIADYYMEYLRHEEQENLICMMLDTKNRLLGERKIFKGTVNASIVSPREVFLEALRYGAVNIILVHNHPSGDATPSTPDLQVTNRIAETGELLGIHLLDHIIIGNQEYISLREKELLS